MQLIYIWTCILGLCAFRSCLECIYMHPCHPLCIWPYIDKTVLLCRSADKVSCPNLTSAQQLPMGFWMGKRPPFWVHFIWICRVLSPLRLYRRQISQNTSTTWCSGPIFSGRLGCQFPEKSPRVLEFHLTSFFFVFTKIQPRLTRFPMILEVELHDIIPQLFPLWSLVSFYRVPT